MTVKALPPGPTGHFLLGSGPDLARDQLGFYAACAREYGDILVFAVLLLTTIAQRFRRTMEPGQRVTPTPYVTVRPEPGLRMRLARR